MAALFILPHINFQTSIINPFHANITFLLTIFYRAVSDPEYTYLGEIKIVVLRRIHVQKNYITKDSHKRYATLTTLAVA